jgi:PAS domain S-box-containing protein
MQDMVDGIPGLFSYIDSSYHVQFMSSQYRDIFNRDDSELVNVHIQDLIGAPMFAERKERYDEALAGRVVQSEVSRVMPNGDSRYFTVTHQPHRDSTGAVIGIISLGIDITERRSVEQVLKKKSEELKRSNLDLEQFAYVASHDLKAPLRAMEALVEWLKDDLEAYREGDVQENLDLLGQRTQRLAILLDDLLAYSRAGRKVGDVRPLNLKSFVEDVAILIAPPEGFRIVADESLDITMTAHHAPLETVLRNLLSNAIKHHPQPENGLIHVYAKDHGDMLIFGVADNGAGIPEEYSEKVFKMFQTLRPRDECEGSGMGLAIVKRIIDWQGGNIWFHAGPEGKGTVFKFGWSKAPQDMPGMDSAEGYADERLEKQAG